MWGEKCSSKEFKNFVNKIDLSVTGVARTQMLEFVLLDPFWILLGFCTKYFETFLFLHRQMWTMYRVTYAL